MDVRFSSALNILPSFTSLLPSLPSLPSCSNFTLNWRDNVVFGGVALAVASAAVSFFLGLTATAVSFAALSVILGFSAYYVHYFNDGKALQDTVSKLEKDRTDLQAAQREMEANAELLRRRYQEVQGINAQLGQNIAALQGRTRELEGVNAHFTATNQALTGNVTNLEQANRDLQERLHQLEQAIPLLKAQVSSFADENTAFGQHLNVLGGDIEAAGGHSVALAMSIQGFDMTFDQNVLELSQQIQRAKEVSHVAFGTMGDQKQALEGQIGTLQQQLTELQTLQGDFHRLTAELEDKKQKLAASTGELEAIDRQFQQRQTEFDATQRALAQAAAQLEQVRTSITAEQVKLEAAKVQLLAVPEKLAQAERELQDHLHEIEATQQESIRKVDAKIAEKIERAKGLNIELADLNAQIAAKRAELAGLHGGGSA